MRRLFISDLHLSPAVPELAQAFRDFMKEHAVKAEELYILGDFFDAWIGDDEDDDFYLALIRDIKAYSDQGLKIYFQHGNRDFLVGLAFAESAGLSLLPETQVIEIGSHRVLLMHGDTLCTDDREYMAFRAQVRNPQWQQQILGLPLQQRRVMAAQLRAQSQSMNSNKAEDIMDVNAEAVSSTMDSHSANILLHGHTHRPNTHELDQGTRMVLGDWGKFVWYASSDGSDLSLHHYLIQ